MPTHCKTHVLSKTLGEQKCLLEKSKTRKVIGRMQMNSSSLYVNRDSASITSRVTDNLSKLSVVFDFDSEIFSSRIYQQVLRASAKNDLRQQQKRGTHPDNHEPREERPRGKGEIKIILLGDANSGKAQFLGSLMGNRYTDQELKSQRLLIRKNMVECVQKLIEMLENDYSPIFQVHPIQCDFPSIKEAVACFSEVTTESDFEIGKAIISLMNDAAVREFLSVYSDRDDLKNFPH
jgi:hypothetical protein